MAQSAQAHKGDSVGSYADFCRDILPRIKADGYTAVQLMMTLLGFAKKNRFVFCLFLFFLDDNSQATVFGTNYA